MQHVSIIEGQGDGENEQVEEPGIHVLSGNLHSAVK